MGLGDIISNAFDFACDLGKKVVSFVHDVSESVRDVAKILSLIPGPIGKISSIVALVAEAVAKITGILLPSENIEDVGERALQAQEHGITLENCNNFDEYMEKLRTFPLDPEISATRPVTDKNIAGFLVVENGLRSKFSDLSVIPLLAAALKNPDFINYERLSEYIQMSNERNVPLSEVFEFFKEGKTSFEAQNIIFDVEKKMNPTASGNEIFEKIKDIPVDKIDLEK